MKIRKLFAVSALGVAFAFPVSAQQMKTLAGMVVNIGLVDALSAEHADAQHGVHKGGHGAGMEHIVVGLAEEKGGARIDDAEVTIAVRNPKGALQKKTALPMTTAGYPDYSEVFDFGWSGKYTVSVLVKRKGATRPTEATFTVRRHL